VFNKYFNPRVPIKPSHVATAPGAAGCIDALLYNICEDGDGVLVPGPYWNGFDFSMRVRSAVNPVVVPLPSLAASFTEAMTEALEETYRTSACPIKALVITNPHNPLAVCYPRWVLEECLRFCNRKGMHFISDEVYALSIFETPDLPDAQPFVSVLSLDLDAIGVDKPRVHVVWSTSKDLGQSGFRMVSSLDICTQGNVNFRKGCTVSQFNEEMAVGVALAANNQISALSTIFVTTLLTSPNLDSLIALNKERLSLSYAKLTNLFKKHGIPYLPCNAGLYVFARLARRATWEDESNMVQKLKQAGVLVSAGKAYHVPESEKGWMRVSFAVHEADLVEAMRRMETVLTTSTGAGEDV
jgi:aspartate/methionine/tyrosine aminotransferase